MKYFYFLQVFRGIAALMVVFHHQWNSFSHFLGLKDEIAEATAALGKYGVDFFFVLSGFIIAFSNEKFRNNRSELGNYLWKRVIRIYIPYLPIGILMLLAYYYIPGFSAAGRDISIGASLLLPFGTPALSVAWTLIHEMIFYLFFSFWFISARKFYWGLLIWIGLILLNTYSGLGYLFNVLGPISDKIFSHYNLEFFVGLFAAKIYLNQSEKISLKWLFILAIFSVILFIYLFLNRLSLFFFLGNISFSVFCASLILLFAINKIDTKYINQRILLIIGNASYSIYLIHNPLISLMARVFPKTPLWYISALEFLIGFILCVLFGVFYSYVFEGRVMTRVRKLNLSYKF
ncbi:acyltransferase family protein [Echinicola shivajiensis]|uniref:acyltransferase family protein n=1 Tax=Echinicola shivajiensis TaxID=1035916 RepID=UPI001BFC5DA9|nr:acyltransferase [Echinicola shivajiensis]